MQRIPVATYRVQLHADFGFEQAADIAGYLHELGVSHVYCSPYLQAAPGSTHGYDIVDHHKVNDELGGAQEHEQFSLRLGACGLGQVLDIVPNHMAISGRRNRLWWDVLENGPSSRYSIYFDIDWQPHQERLRNKLLVPILGDHYGKALARGEIELKRRGGEFFIQYFDQELPVGPRSLPAILSASAKESGSDYLAFLADSLGRLPGPTLTDRASVTERHRDKEVIRGLLERLFSETPFIGEVVDKTLEQFNLDPARMDEVLELQTYRLAFWRTAKQELAYRRFFDVNTLVGLRMEDPQVFADTHALIFRWLREGVLDGIRIDHPDGLRDPRQYFERLRQNAPGVWIIGEKILEPGERFRSEWPIDGTTGYDYLNQVTGLFVDSCNEQAFTELYSTFTHEPTDYGAICRDKKHRVLRDLLGSDVNRLTSLLLEICESHRERRDYTREDIIRVIREIVAVFPVYRTFVVPERDEIAEDDARYIDETIDAVKAGRSDLDADLLEFVRDILLMRVRGPLETEFVMRFQQFTGPAMAKGVEDTVFYSFNRLISLNDVGGDPGRFGISPEAFHQFCAETQRSHPKTMLASSTHDTKRSEDVRARINVLSEIPKAWKEAVERWSQINSKHKTGRWPDRNTEYLLYQTMVGAWPIPLNRIQTYMEKACREAKQHTSWLDPHVAFESATQNFIAALYGDREFLDNLEKFVALVVEPGRINSLSQLLLKLTSPGIPDLYQGTELWALDLVDPDNRRPVEYDIRRALLAELPSLTVRQVWERIDEGLPKLWTIYHALRTRRRYPAAFGERGGYTLLQATGEKAIHLIAYLRGKTVAVFAPRLVWRLGGDWSDTQVEIPSGNWRNVLSHRKVNGGSVELGKLLTEFPVALLVKQ